MTPPNLTAPRTPQHGWSVDAFKRFWADPDPALVRPSIFAPDVVGDWPGNGQPVRAALDRFLRAHEPFPAVVIDRRWNLVASNGPVELLTEGAAAELLAPPANALRLTLHPEGMAPRIANLAEWSGHLLQRLRRQAAVTGDAELEQLHDELADYPGVVADPVRVEHADADIVLPLRLRVGDGELAFFSTVSTFGTAVDVTLAELSIEAFYPADDATAAVLLRAAG